MSRNAPNLVPEIEAAQAEIAEWRRALHAQPATAYEENFISDFVAAKLTEWGIPHRRGLAGTGIVASIAGRGNGAGAIGLRADMDALNIAETTGKPWASQVPGKMHACGHDGHTAMLLAAARHLAASRNFDGAVRLVFQPAEEAGTGAGRMLDDGLLRDFPMQAIYGIHNWPDLPLGTAGVRPGPMMASVEDFVITVTGRGGHAGIPHLNDDPVPVAALIITAVQTLVSRTVDPLHSAVVSVTMMEGSRSVNITPGAVTLRGTLRALDPAVRADLNNRLGRLAEGIAQGFGMIAETRFEDGLGPVVNHPAQAEAAADALRDVLGDAAVNAAFPPSLTAEDFGSFLAVCPGSFAFIGQADAGHKGKLHQPDYDFNDALLPIGASYFVRLVERVLPL